MSVLRRVGGAPRFQLAAQLLNLLVRLGREFFVRASSDVGVCVFDSALEDVDCLWRRVEYIPRERREGIRDGETDRVHRGEILGCLLERLLVSVVACG